MKRRSAFCEAFVQISAIKNDDVTLHKQALSHAILHEDFQIARSKRNLFSEKVEIRRVIKEIVLTEDRIDELPVQLLLSYNARFFTDFGSCFRKSLKRKNEIAYPALPNDMLKRPRHELLKNDVPIIQSDTMLEFCDLETNSDSNSVATTEVSCLSHSYFSPSEEKKSSSEDHEKIDIEAKDDHSAPIQGEAEVYYNKALDIFEAPIPLLRDNFNRISDHYYKAISNMQIAATIYRSQNKRVDLQSAIRVQAKQLEKVADLLMDLSTENLKDVYPDRQDKIKYYKLAASFYEKAIILRTSIGLNCKFSLFLSPLYIYYKLAYTFELNRECQIRLMRNHMRRYNLYDLVGQAKENQLKEFQEYVDFIDDCTLMCHQPKLKNGC